MNEIFDIEKFNIFSDDENYYFFRALNMGDNNDVESKITSDINGNITSVRSDRKRFDGIPRYNDDSIISLEEMFDHIKMHNSKDTNCISLTSNANTVLDYGRGNYKDKYVIVKVPKNELGKKVYSAGLYMLDEINNRINELILSNIIDQDTVKYLKRIDEINDLDELKTIIDRFKEYDLDNQLFKRGINYIKPDAVDVLYQTLDQNQNLEKNKLVAKLYILNRNIYPNIGNKILLQTVGNAFSSMELIHYNDILKDEIINVSKEVIDALSLIQQLPKENLEVINLKNEMLHFLTSNQSIVFDEFKYQNYNINDEITIEDMFNMTNGSINYFDASNVYKKIFYLSKSKLRAKHFANELYKVTLNDEEYTNLINYISNNCYGIEPEIILRQNNKGYNLSESVNLDINNKEIELLNELSKYSDSILSYIVENPKKSLTYFLDNLSYLPRDNMDKQTYYANAILDLYDWKSLEIDSFTVSQRNEIIYRLKKIDCVSIYNYLKHNNVKEKDISRIIFVMMVKNKDLSQISLNENITIDELEDYLGYYEIKDTNIKLRDYQANTLKKIDNTFKNKKFTSAILPTGAGKSFVALAEMLEYKNKEILYLAPNDEILSQIESYIIQFIHGTKGSLGSKRRKQIIKNTFPNLRLETYSYLSNSNDSENIINHNYDLIIFDELHRTGASEWGKKVDNLLDYQNENVKVLGITATPVRDVDGIDMSDTIAKKLGYTDKEIKKKKHIASNMSLIDAIKLGIVVNPKIVNCEYTLTRSGKTERILEQINEIADEEKKNNLLQRFDFLRRQLENSKGIPEILDTYLKQGNKYIVFLPVTKKDNGTFEDEDGNPVSKQKAESVIKAYQNQMKQYIFIQKYLNNNEIIYDIYNKIKSGVLLTNDEINWLENEKENILLLTKIKNIKESDILTTQQNDMAYLIIKTMNWDYLDESKKGKLLNEKVKDYMNSYSMLGSYGKDKNNKELLNFESDESDKYKFMFVMNKLNEGTHVKKINGLIWFRPLDENSYILYMQQLGRIIYSLDPTKEYTDDDRPIAIDLTNNTLRVDMEKNRNEKESDLVLLQTVMDWMFEHNNIIPNINSSDKIESRYASILKHIQEKYSIYLNKNEFDKLNEKDKEDVQEILKLGSMIALWNITFDEKIGINKTKVYENGLDELFELTPVLRDFYDLEKEVEAAVKIDWIPEFIEFINEGNTPGSNLAKETRINGAIVAYLWTSHKDKILNRFDTDPVYKSEKYNKAREIFHPKDWIAEFIEFINKGNTPGSNLAFEARINGAIVANLWNHNKDKILNRFDTDPVYKSEKYNKAREIFHPKDWIAEFIEFINKGNTPGSNLAFEARINGAIVANLWNHNKDKILNRFDTDPVYKSEKYNKAREIFHPKDWIAKFIEFINKGNTPSGKLAFATRINGAIVANLWHGKKEKILNRFYIDPVYKSEKYNIAREIFEKYKVKYIYVDSEYNSYDDKYRNNSSNVK